MESDNGVIIDQEGTEAGESPYVVFGDLSYAGLDIEVSRCC